METAELVGNARSIAGDPRPKCSKCAHYKVYPPDPVLYLFPKTRHHCTKAIDLVTGNTIETDCYAMRHIRGECGPDAKLFEEAGAAKKEEAPPTPLTVLERGLVRGLKALLVGFAVSILALISILALLFWVYERERPRPVLIKTGDVKTGDAPKTGEASQMGQVSVKDGPSRVTARTRLLTIGDRRIWQFEASPGEWKDCGDDCEKALRRSLAK